MKVAGLKGDWEDEDGGLDEEEGLDEEAFGGDGLPFTGFFATRDGAADGTEILSTEGPVSAQKSKRAFKGLIERRTPLLPHHHRGPTR